MGCGTSFVKYVLFFFNLVVALFGLAVIGIGVAFLLNWTVVKDELKSHLTVAPWVFIIIGAIMFVIAFFGCCGAIRESHCMVVTYAIFLLVIIIVQVVIGVLLLVYGESINQSIVKSVDALFDKRASANVDKATDTVINNMQQQFACCGKNGPQDYGLSISLPDSCCSTTSTLGSIIGGRCTIEVAHRGCAGVISELYEKWNKPIAGIAIGIACVELIGALFSLYLANSIRNMDRRYA
ncbi:23 kDa integral membrane protein isoform X2 [Helicoverpa armigera]|uniref:23 kDa integral membrane protein isoform X2 n=1 Tax=Helicoverpa armigera TaxID=29058 RepID=UPI000B395D41|nr:23 kDa integral membrane protein isoform X2 [Helicoverpa armigera]XP_047021154.1 23 kDa integral membrane protein-like isoform X2 [Helicoverpa zea]